MSTYVAYHACCPRELGIDFGDLIKFILAQAERLLYVLVSLFILVAEELICCNIYFFLAEVCLGLVLHPIE